MDRQAEDLAVIARAVAAKILAEAETKRIFKEALSEWLDKRFEEFGRSSMKALLAMLFAALITFVMWTQGYHKP